MKLDATRLLEACGELGSIARSITAKTEPLGEGLGWGRIDGDALRAGIGALASDATRAVGEFESFAPGASARTQALEAIATLREGIGALPTGSPRARKARDAAETINEGATQLTEAARQLQRTVELEQLVDGRSPAELRARITELASSTLTPDDQRDLSRLLSLPADHIGELPPPAHSNYPIANQLAQDADEAFDTATRAYSGVDLFALRHLDSPQEAVRTRIMELAGTELGRTQQQELAALLRLPAQQVGELPPPASSKFPLADQLIADVANGTSTVNRVYSGIDIRALRLLDHDTPAIRARIVELAGTELDRSGQQELAALLLLGETRTGALPTPAHDTYPLLKQLLEDVANGNRTHTRTYSSVDLHALRTMEISTDDALARIHDLSRRKLSKAEHRELAALLRRSDVDEVAGFPPVDPKHPLVKQLIADGGDGSTTLNRTVSHRDLVRIALATLPDSELVTSARADLRQILDSANDAATAATRIDEIADSLARTGAAGVPRSERLVLDGAAAGRVDAMVDQLRATAEAIRSAPADDGAGLVW